MKEIGGYFELELNNFNTIYHDNAIAVNSGRNALEYYLLANNHFSKVFLPYFSCDSLLIPLERLNISYELYYLDDNLLPKIEKVKKNELVIYINFFGLMSNKIKKIYNLFENILIDNAQAFFSMPYKNLPTIYSPRKFFGVPDGGFVYSNKKISDELKVDSSVDRFRHLLLRIEKKASSGLDLYRQNNKLFNKLPLKKMSRITRKLLLNIDFDNVKNKRNINFNFLHDLLKNTNEFTNIIENAEINAPLIYPYLNKNNRNKRRILTENKIYIAQYWPNVPKSLSNKNTIENYLFHQLLAIPIDQRYNPEDLIKIVNLLN